MRSTSTLANSYLPFLSHDSANVQADRRGLILTTSDNATPAVAGQRAGRGGLYPGVHQGVRAGRLSARL